MNEGRFASPRRAPAIATLFVALASLPASSSRAQDPPTLEGYVEEALRSSLALRQSELDVEVALAALDEARRLFRPSLDLSARYSRADGGRTIEFPVGDLVNPVTATLNELLVDSARDPRFAPLDNQEVPFLRSREQDTRLRLSQPLFRPRLSANLRARRAELDASLSGHEVFARNLARDVRVAYWRTCQAAEVTNVLEATRALVAESLRVAESRFARGSVTEDEVFRERAELANVGQRLLEAERERERSVRFLDFLVNRPLDVTSDRSGCETEIPVGPEAAGGRRAELEQLDDARRAAAAGVDATRAQRRPTLDFALDLGAQGETYDLNEGFWQASLVLSWNLSSFGRNEARARRSRREVERLETLRRDVERRIGLERRDADDRVEVARAAIAASTRRVAAAEEAYRIVERRERAGRVPQVSLTDARRELTAARVEAEVAVFELRIALAELDRARGADQRLTEAFAASLER